MLTGRLRLHACIASALTTSVGRRYDTLVMEESAQILEIETFIPMLLQAPQDGHNRLKRVRLYFTAALPARSVCACLGCYLSRKSGHTHLARLRC